MTDREALLLALSASVDGEQPSGAAELARALAAGERTKCERLNAAEDTWGPWRD